MRMFHDAVLEASDDESKVKVKYRVETPNGIHLFAFLSLLKGCHFYLDGHYLGIDLSLKISFYPYPLSDGPSNFISMS